MFGVGFGRPAVAVVSLVLVCLPRVRCWFWPSRGCGGFVSLSLFDSRSALILAVPRFR